MGSKAAVADTVEADKVTVPRGKLSPGPGMAAKEVAAHQLARIRRATVEIVADRGYKALKVRDLVRSAEVSTRAFYEHFGSKEECVLDTYDLIARRATRRIITAQAGEADWRTRLRLILEEFLWGLERAPADARVALLEVYAASDTLTERVLSAEQAFEGMLVECLSRPIDGVVVPPIVVAGMVGGVAGIARRRLRAEDVSGLWGSRDELVEWALCYPDDAATRLGRLDLQTVWRDTTLEPSSTSHSDVGGHTSGDRALILAAAARLAVSGGYASLTVPRIRSAASVSRRKFHAYFDDIEDCYLAVLELRTAEALAQAARAQTAASSWAGGVYRAVAALYECIARDAFLANVWLRNDFPLSQSGARSRRRLLAAIGEQFVPPEGSARQSALVGEASASAVWSVLRRHAVRERAMRRKSAATLSYLLLAPQVGAGAAIEAIHREQAGPALI